MGIAENLKKLRKQRKWSQKELAAKAGCHPGHIIRIEGGKYKPSTDSLVKLAEVLEVSVEALLSQEEILFKAGKAEDKGLAQRMKLIETLDTEERKALLFVIDAVLTQKKVLTLLTRHADLSLLEEAG